MTHTVYSWKESIKLLLCRSKRKYNECTIGKMPINDKGKLMHVAKAISSINIILLTSNYTQIPIEM